MREYTVLNSETGQEITFDWDDDINDPTDYDMEEIFSSAKQFTPQQTPAVKDALTPTVTMNVPKNAAQPRFTTVSEPVEMPAATVTPTTEDEMKMGGLSPTGFETGRAISGAVSGRTPAAMAQRALAAGGRLISQEQQKIAPVTTDPVKMAQKAQDTKKVAEMRGVAAELLDPTWYNTERYQKQLEKIREKDPDIANSFSFGGVAAASNIATFKAFLGGNQAAKDAALANELSVRSVAEERQTAADKKKGITGKISNLTNSVAEMTNMLATGAAVTAVPVVGPLLSSSMWAMQGGGDIIAQAKEQGADDDAALGFGVLGGIAYAGVESLQLGQLLNTGTKKIIQGTIKRKIANLLLEKGKDYLKEVTEEGVQGVIVEDAIISALKESGITVDDAMQRKISAFKDNTISSLGPMGVLSVVGLGADDINDPTDYDMEEIFSSAKQFTPQQTPAVKDALTPTVTMNVPKNAAQPRFTTVSEPVEMPAATVTPTTEDEMKMGGLSPTGFETGRAISGAVSGRTPAAMAQRALAAGGRLISQEQQKIAPVTTDPVKMAQKAQDTKKVAEMRGVAAELLDPTWYNTERYQKQLEKIREKDPDIANSFSFGGVAAASNIATFKAFLGGNQAAKDAALANELSVRSVAEERQTAADKKKGITGKISNLTNSVAEMTNMLATGAAVTAVPVVGPLLSSSMWAMQGGGDIIAQAKEQGADDDAALGFGVLGGIAYAGVESLQLGQLLNTGTKKIIQGTIKRKIANLLLEKGKDYLKEVTEEGVQGVIVEDAIISALKESGITVDDAMQRKISAFKDNTISSLGPMGVLSVVGLGAGMATVRGNKKSGQLTEIKNKDTGDVTPIPTGKILTDFKLDTDTYFQKPEAERMEIFDQLSPAEQERVAQYQPEEAAVQPPVEQPTPAEQPAEIEVKGPEYRDRITALTKVLQTTKDKKQVRQFVESMTPEEAKEVLKESQGLPAVDVSKIPADELEQVAAYGKEGRVIGGRKYPGGAIPAVEKKMRYMELDKNDDLKEMAPKILKDSNVIGVTLGKVESGISQPGAMNQEPRMSFRDEYTGSNINVTKAGGAGQLKARVAEVRAAEPEKVANKIAEIVGGLEFVRKSSYNSAAKGGGKYETQQIFIYKTPGGTQVTIDPSKDNEQTISNFIQKKESQNDKGRAVTPVNETPRPTDTPTGKEAGSESEEPDWVTGDLEVTEDELAREIRPEELDEVLTDEDREELETLQRMSDAYNRSESTRTELDRAKKLRAMAKGLTGSISKESLEQAGDRSFAAENARFVSKTGKPVDRVRMDFIEENRGALQEMGIREEDLANPSDFVDFIRNMPTEKQIADMEQQVKDSDAELDDMTPKFARRETWKDVDGLEELRKKYDKMGVDVAAYGNKDIHLGRIEVPKNDRMKGIGTKAMEDLVAVADNAGSTITLSPTGEFGGNKKRLIEFYKRFGFVENKGRKKDYRISSTMYRRPNEVKFARRDYAQQDMFGGEKTGTEIETDRRKQAERAEVKRRTEERKGGEADMRGLPMFEDADIEGSQQTLKFARRSKSGTPPNNESDYVKWSDLQKEYKENYFNQSGEKIASSREVPARVKDLPIGAWRIDDFNGLYGREISQLRMIDPNDLIDVEEPEKYRRDDVDRYEKWSKDGLVPPPIEVVKQTTNDGKLKIVDGHRRAAAAKRLGIKIPAWVSPVADHPDGMTDAEGKIQKVGMTFEMVSKQEPQFARRQTPTFDEIYSSPQALEAAFDNMTEERTNEVLQSSIKATPREIAVAKLSAKYLPDIKTAIEEDYREEAERLYTAYQNELSKEIAVARKEERGRQTKRPDALPDTARKNLESAKAVSIVRSNSQALQVQLTSKDDKKHSRYVPWSQLDNYVGKEIGDLVRESKPHEVVRLSDLDIAYYLDDAEIRFAERGRDEATDDGRRFSRVPQEGVDRKTESVISRMLYREDGKAAPETPVVEIIVGDPAQQKFARVFSKLANKPVVLLVVDNQRLDEDGVRGFDGFQLGGKIYLNVSGAQQRPLLWTAFHEWYHGLSDTDRAFVEEAAKLTDLGKRVLSSTEEGEFFPDIAGEILSDPKVLNYMARKNPVKFKRIIKQLLDALNDLIEKFRTLVTGESKTYDRYITNAEDIRDRLITVLEKRMGSQMAGEMAAVFAERQQADQTETEAFKKWFAGSKVVDEDGKPLVVYHGTTSEFTIFDKNKSNAESDLGAGFYFTNNAEDVGENYAGFGPDLTQKIKLAVERIRDMDVDEIIEKYGTDEATAKKIKDQNEGGWYKGRNDIARKIVREKFAKHEGAVMPVYLSIKNPVVIEKKGGTFLEYGPDMEYYTNEAKDEISKDDYSDDEDAYNEALEEKAREMYYEDYDPKTTGSAAKLGDALQTVSNEYGIDNPIQSGDDYLEEGMYASDFIDKLKKDENVIYVEDENGKLAVGEFIRKVFEEAGFDGFIDKTVDVKFGSQRKTGKSMAGMDYDTVHYIAFSPTQIKSATGNRGTFDPENPDIRFAERGRDETTDNERVLRTAQERRDTPMPPNERDEAGMATERKDRVNRNDGDRVRERIPGLDKEKSGQGDGGTAGTRNAKEIEMSIKSALRKAYRESGVDPNYDVVTVIDPKPEQKQIVDTFSKLNKVPVIPIRVDEETLGRETGYLFDGFYDRGRIFLNIDSERPLLWTLWHEFYHSLPRSDREFIEDAARLTPKGERVFNDTEAGEFFPDIFGEMFSQPETLRYMAKKNPVKFKRIIRKLLDIITDLIDRFNNLISGKDNPRYAEYITNAEDIRDRLITVLEKRMGSQMAGEMAAVFAERQQAETFFSPLLKAVQGIKQERGTGDQMFAMITKTTGVKEAEWKWLGLDDFLKGKKSVTRQEVEDFVRENQVQVEEVKKGGDGKFVTALTDEERTRWAELRNEFAQWDSAKGEYVGARKLTPEEQTEKKGYEDRHDKAVKTTKEDKTKYSQYQLPGGENYREVLLTLPIDGPNKEILKHDRYSTDMDTFLNSLDGGDPPPLKGLFKSSHWDEPNVIAHIRMNDRTGPDGEKVLFVEEIQSDFSRELRSQQKANMEIVDKRWGGLLERMKKDGILKVVCP